MLLFASPRFTVRKPLHLEVRAGVRWCSSLQEAGLLGRCFERLPPGSDTRHKGFAALAIQHRFASGIPSIDSDKCLSNLLRQGQVHIAVDRKAAMTVTAFGGTAVVVWL